MELKCALFAQIALAVAAVLLLDQPGNSDAAPLNVGHPMVCAEYVANGMNAPPPSDDDDDDDDRGGDSAEFDSDDRSSAEDYIIDIPPASSATAAPRRRPTTTQAPPGIVQCAVGQQFCYSVWKLDAIGTATIIRQGCWQSDERQSACQSERCISGAPSGGTLASGRQSHRFCCCSGAMCNQNTTIIEQIHLQKTPAAEDEYGDGSNNAAGLDGPVSQLRIAWLNPTPLAAACVFVTLAIVVLALLVTLSTGRKYVAEMTPAHRVHELEAADATTATTNSSTGSAGGGCPPGPGYTSTAQSVDNLLLCSMIGRGRYGTVWQGVVNERPVAVKIFPAQHRQYFVNERNIYSLPLMQNPSLLEYYGADTRRTMTDQIEHLLVLALAPHGCLQDWLQSNTCTFAEFARMAKSVIHGLSHLHTEMSDGSASKPCVCHRDLNTRNILVKADGTCCIADFGFALKMYGGKYEWKGEMALAETKSVAEVGTLRYMAPEVLEGAVNLRDCETALKQIDVYALGLVLWELCTRCADWYPSAADVPAYQAPYEADVGKHPSFEHMQLLVARHKVRPVFAAAWGGQSASARLARETCEDCWDHDSEARLTALCAEERMAELAVLGPRAQSSRPISPDEGTTTMTTTTAATVQNKQQIAAEISPPLNSGGGTAHDVYRSTQMTNVTTAVITPPNQIITDRAETAAAAKVVTVTSRALLDYHQQHHHHQYNNPNHYGNDGANSVEELLSDSASSASASASLSLASTTNQSAASATGDRSESTTAEAGGVGAATVQPSRGGWYGVRALIERNLFKRRQPPVVKSVPTEVNAVALAPAPPLAVHLRPRNLGLETLPHATTTLPRASNATAAAGSIQHPFTQGIDSDRSVSCTQINAPHLLNVDADAPPPARRHQAPRIVISKSATNVLPVENAATAAAAELRQLKRQCSLDRFHEVFGAKGSIERLRDPAHRVKTPGDVPAAVRRMRASKTLSLYDDRMMDFGMGSVENGGVAETAIERSRSIERDVLM